MISDSFINTITTIERDSEITVVEHTSIELVTIGEGGIQGAKGDKGDSSLIVAPYSEVSVTSRANKLVVDTDGKRLVNHDESGDEIPDHTFDVGDIKQKVDELYVPFEIVDLNVGIAYFDTDIDSADDCDIAMGYDAGKALIHVVVVDGVAQILKGFQVGVELSLAFTCEVDANGKHRIKIVNAGNAVDIQLKTLKTKLFGGL